jgi:hypothetical protein
VPACRPVPETACTIDWVVIGDGERSTSESAVTLAHARDVVFGDSAFRWRLGLRPLDLADWIEWGPTGDEAVARKASLVEEHHDTVFATIEGIEADSNEMAAVLFDHLQDCWPERYGSAELDSHLHPLDAVARLVPEDLVLMVQRDGRLVFGGGSVCFPNRWDLRSKLGLTMAEVHAPVAELNHQLEDSIDRFLGRLTPERSFWRLGWGILDTDDWYTPIDGTGPAPQMYPEPASMFLRVERETLRRFPRTRAVLFTIRTSVTPLSTVAADVDLSKRLASALEHMPPSVRAYKDVAGMADALVAHFRDRITSGENSLQT